MNRSIYALFIGIDTYQPPVRPLRGCVNDITRLSALLAARAEDAGDAFNPLPLENSAATRQAVIDGFRRHLGQAGENDVALFYYSGHGSQQKSPPEFWHLEPDRLDETLVCYDSRQPGSWDLADKELAQLIAEVAAKGAHVVVVLDCCHSGSGTRNADGTGVRRVATDERDRPLKTFIVQPDAETARAVESEKESGWVSLPKGRHILLAACRSDEEAKESALGGKPHGVFSHFLAETLEQAAAPLTYREVFKRVNALVRSHAALQSPQAEPTDHAMLGEYFLDGTAGARGRSYTLSHDTAAGWVIDAGAVHGIPAPAGDEAALFALFALESSPTQWRDMKAALGTARVRRVEPARSRVDVTFGAGAPDQGQVYKAVLAAMPLAPMEVQFTGEAGGLDRALVALAKADATGRPSFLVRKSPRADAALRLVALEGGGYRILRPADGQPLVGDVDGATTDAAKLAVEKLEHIARWMQIVELRNPADTLLGKAVSLEIFPATGDSKVDEVAMTGSTLRLEYERDPAGVWQQPKFRVRLTNRDPQKRPLHCALVGLTQTFAVDTSLLSGGAIRLEHGEEKAAWANGGEPIYSEVPDALWQAGMIEVRDVLKLIVSTEPMDATLLEQGELDLPILRRGATRGVGEAPKITSTLDRLMERMQTRALSSRPANAETISDWATQEISFATVRPRESAAVAAAGAVTLISGVTLLAHPTLQANARLTAAPAASRDVAGGFVLPPLLRDHVEVSQPFPFSSSRGGGPGLSVLELHDVKNPEAVTRAQPLRLRIAEKLAEGEHILPVTHDGEFYLPIGRGRARDGAIEVEIDALPPPINTRSLIGAVRIYFQKIISRTFGTRYEYPLLAAYTPAADGEAQTTADPAEVKKKVAAAQRIALYVHGIIGETRGMAASAAGLAGPPLVAGLGDRYDLILTFDYENLDTSIADNARLLRDRLAAVGLGPVHGKTLHVIAHSMGGLVSRWFIEREGGNEVVQHLAMLGTPNGGSPWPKVEDWAVTALSLGLNGLAASFWPAGILGHLVSALEKIDTALDEMNPSSQFLRDLHASPDPKVPYTIIAGNTSLIGQADAAKNATRLSLLERLRKFNLLHLATAPLFFGEANDIAVSVANIRLQPAGREPAATIREVACDHLTYFSTEAGLRELAKLLPR